MELKTIKIDDVEYVRRDSISEPPQMSDYYIVRTYSAGVFAGNILKREGMEVTMTNARRIWQWSGAATLSQLALEGTKNPTGCKFPEAVPEVLLTQAIEILKCTKGAEESIKGVPVWKK